MISTLRRGANAILFVIACLLGADTANAIFAAVVLPPAERQAEATREQPVQQSTWADRQVILDRNVFQSSTLAPPQQAAGDLENLEATKLALTLLGTAASEDPKLAWAAIQDRDARATLIVGVGQSIQGKATVVRVERQRVVLLEGGAHRELAFDEEDLTPRLAAAPAQTAADRAAARRAARLQRLSENTFDAQQLANNPAQILTEARWLPKYEDGQMKGVQVSQIKPGSMLEQAGLQEGDVITGVNGLALDSPEQSPILMNELTNGKPIVVDTNRGQITVDPSQLGQ